MGVIYAFESSKGNAVINYEQEHLIKVDNIGIDIVIFVVFKH